MSNHVDDMSTEDTKTKSWDESRILVFLIGFFLMVEGLLVYFQIGYTQASIAAISASAGLILSVFAILMPSFEDHTPIDVDEPEDLEIIQKKHVKKPLPEKKAIKPDNLTKDSQKQVIEKQEISLKQEIDSTDESLSWFERLNRGLSKTRTGFSGKIKKLVFGKTTIDDELLDDIEETLFEADVGVTTTQKIIKTVSQKVEEEDIKDPQQIYDLIKQQFKSMLARFTPTVNFNTKGLTVILVVGVNGVGKTTTIAKLAHNFTSTGKKVVLAAGDTFRAAAIDQLCIWGERVGVEVIKGKEGGDPGALVFDAIHAAKKREANLLIIDTAGRMHVKANLMAELKKVQKIAQKESDGGPHEILLILDATTGQNAVQQAKLFKESLPITGVVMTKLDGTARGGVLFAVEEEINAPVKFIGVGEKMQDLMPFNADNYIQALFSEGNETKQSDYEVM